MMRVTRSSSRERRPGGAQEERQPVQGRGRGRGGGDPPDVNNFITQEEWDILIDHLARAEEDRDEAQARADSLQSLVPRTISLMLKRVNRRMEKSSRRAPSRAGRGRG